MARLGEAYVRVRADLKDFDADLDKALKKSTDRFEKAFNASLGRRVGRELGEGVGSELDASLTASAKAFSESLERRGREGGQRGGRGAGSEFRLAFLGSLKTVASSIGGLITDGLSGLPPQVRAVLGATVLATFPPLVAGLASALVAGTASAVTGVGIALASQFDIVQESAKIFGRGLRETLVEAARPFIDPILDGFGRIEAFIGEITGRISNIFAKSATFVEPLTSGLISLLDYATAGIEHLVTNSDGLVGALAQGFVFLGSAVEQSLTILSDLGEDGEDALRDMIFAISDIIVFTAKFLAVITEAYGAVRDFAQSTEALAIAAKVASPTLTLMESAFDDVDEATVRADRSLNEYGLTTHQYRRAQQGAITATAAQTKELKDQARAIDDARAAQFRAIDSTLSYLDSLSNLTKTLKENRGAFSFQSEAGRESIRAVGTAFKEAEDRAKDLYATRQLTAEQAQELYEQEREEIYRNAAAQGINKAAIDAVYGSISSIIALPPVDNKFGAFTSGITAAEDALRELRREASRGGFTPNVGVGEAASVPGYAHGGIITSPHLAMVGEGGNREVVLPLTNPRRTRELAQQSGLMNVLGGDGASTVIVMIGNEQLDSRMYRVANRNSRDQARMMTQGPRMN